MKTIITAILLFLISFNANAIDKESTAYRDSPIPYSEKYEKLRFVINGVTLTYKEIYNKYYEWKTTANKNEIVFFPKNTVACQTKEGFIKAYEYRISTNYIVDKRNLLEMGCAVQNRGNATLVEQEERSTIVKLIFESARVPQLRVGFFDKKDLMTVAQFEQRMTIQ